MYKRLNSMGIGCHEEKVQLSNHLLHRSKRLCEEIKHWNRNESSLYLQHIGEKPRSPYKKNPKGLKKDQQRPDSDGKQNAENKFAREVSFENRDNDQTERPSKTNETVTLGKMNKATQVSWHDFQKNTDLSGKDIRIETYDKKEEETKEKEGDSSEDRRSRSRSSEDDGNKTSSDKPEPVPAPRGHKMTSKPSGFKFTMFREGGGSMKHPDYVHHPILKNVHEKQTNDDFNFVIKSQRPGNVSVSKQKDLLSWTATLSRATKDGRNPTTDRALSVLVNLYHMPCAPDNTSCSPDLLSCAPGSMSCARCSMAIARN